MLSRLEAGLQNPIDFQAELIAECKASESLNTEAFLTSCAEYETKTGKKLRDKERAALLFATVDGWVQHAARRKAQTQPGGLLLPI